MMRAAIAMLLAAFWLPASAGDAQFKWPNGAIAAVSLAYDDALDSQLDHALPALDKAGLKASFYLTLSSPVVVRRMDAWRAAARSGHELGNHSLFHQCSGKGAGREWVEPHRDLASTSARQMQDQVQLANTMLHAIDGRRERTYTAPCGDRLAGDTPYLPLIAPDFIAIKAGGAERVPASMNEIDPHAVPVFAPVDLSGPQLIALVKAAGERGTMVNFTFHGIGGDYLQVSKEAHAQLVQFLAKNRHLYWTDTFGRIMQHVKTERATSSTGQAR